MTTDEPTTIGPNRAARRRIARTLSREAAQARLYRRRPTGGPSKYDLLKAIGARRQAALWNRGHKLSFSMEDET